MSHSDFSRIDRSALKNPVQFDVQMADLEAHPEDRYAGIYQDLQWCMVRLHKAVWIAMIADTRIVHLTQNQQEHLQKLSLGHGIIEKVAFECVSGDNPSYRCCAVSDHHIHESFVKHEFLTFERVQEVIFRMIDYAISCFTRICCVCGSEGRQRCGKCRSTRYCSRECQRADWKRHRQFCVKKG